MDYGACLYVCVVENFSLASQAASLLCSAVHCNIITDSMGAPSGGGGGEGESLLQDPCTNEQVLLSPVHARYCWHETHPFTTHTQNGQCK